MVFATLASFLAPKIRSASTRRAVSVRPALSLLGLSMGLCSLLATNSGCATYSESTSVLRDDVARNDPNAAIAAVNDKLGVTQASQLPDHPPRDGSLLLLERGMLLQAISDYPNSARNLEAADKDLEFLDLSRDAVGKLGKYIYSDSATKFKSSATEKLALNTINMINYLVRGDLNGARVESKRLATMQRYLNDFDPKHSYGAFGSYLSAFVHEQLGEYDPAMRLYADVWQQIRSESAAISIVALAGKSSVRTPVIEAILATPPAAAAVDSAQDTGDILLLAKVGRVPYREAVRLPIGAAVALAGGFISGDMGLLPLLGTKFVNFPDLVPSGSLLNQVDVAVDGQQVSVELVARYGDEIAHEFELLKPRIIGAAISRLIARAAAGEGARAAGKAVGGRGSAGGEVVGLLAALAVEGTMVALDRPDTRSWTMLPDYVFVARLRLPAGSHQLQLKARGAAGVLQTWSREISVTAGGFTVFDFTDLR